MIEQMLNRTVTIVHRIPDVDYDEFSGPLPDAPSTETMGSLDQIQRRELDGQGELAAAAYTLFLPAGTIIDSNDSVSIDGVSYELVGEPFQVENKLTGVIHHLECTVERTGNDDAGS